MSLKGKRVLITAGPTWVPIDSVRVISNIASGETGILLAREARRKGAQVSLLLGPVAGCSLDKSIRVLHFKFFDELKNRLVKELNAKKYDVIIHSAAVSDYRPRKTFKNKIDSGRAVFNLGLVATIKLVNLVKKIDNSVFAVGFKFEPGAKLNKLIRRAQALLETAHLDSVVANSMANGTYRAYILNRNGFGRAILSKEILARELIKKIGEHFGGN